MVSDDHKGLKAAASKVLGATWQRCRVQFMRNVLARVNKSQKEMVAAFIRTAFAQDTAEDAHRQWREIADHLRPRFDKVAGIMDEAEHDLLAYMQFPKELRNKLHSTNTLERLNREVKRRTEGVGLRGLTPRHWRDVPARSPTKTPSSGSSAPSCLNSTRNGPSAAPNRARAGPTGHFTCSLRRTT